jgi:hypothetical protein
LNDFRSASSRRIDQQAKSVFIDQIDSSPFVDKNTDRFEIFPESGQPERRIAVAIAQVDVGTVFD